MRLGILGGSFNPVHLGHLFLADKAINALKLDRLVMIPAYISPFKIDAPEMESSVNDRIKMLAAAIAGDSRLTIDDCEINRQGISYTIDTLKDIISRYNPEGRLYLVIGDDLAKDFPKWRESEKILKLANVVIARRLNSGEVKYPFPHLTIENDIINISSQAVRKQIAEGSGWRSLVPSSVRAVIEDRQLYNTCKVKPDVEFSQSLIMQIEEAARETLSVSRFLHSRNTALLARDLCRRFSLDQDAGYIAGIAHDLCKQFDPKQMTKLAKSDRRPISALEKEKPSLLHGRAAAILLKERYCINNNDILEAVAFHTSGRENMSSLAKVIYIADKAEVSRTIDPGIRSMCCGEDFQKTPEALDIIFSAVLRKTVSKLQARELNLSLDTLKLLERMKDGKD
ncbi:MAG: nicotinate (nicotinamide) nucleotide adenylyltransferase [Treponema sp.]|nr:nicotinate (nicotinamide) nucleotide adenylyltransferase [Treponema sp.]MCL2272608.1 nicotinate (nicotinamide) nucleotide adenylyltransferase [Treponema sp.]